MKPNPISWCLVLISSVLLSLGGGCSAPDRHLVLTESGLDVENRYPAAVMIKLSLDQGGNRTCSGVVISSRLVLTAAHCVCGLREAAARKGEPPQAGTIRIDGSTCASSATVTTVLYRPPRMTDSDHRGHDGRVRAHRDFKIVLDQQGNVLKNEADLAVIALEEPLAEVFRPALLADDEVRINDRVLLVGYGYDRRTNGYSGDRRSGMNTVAALAASGRTFLVGQKGTHTLAGDSGGPCFRDGTLVGVATTSSSPPVELSEFTSTYFYRQWLREELQRVGKRNSAVRPDAP